MPPCRIACEGFSGRLLTLRYYRSYENPQQAKDTFAKIPDETAGRLLTLDFSEAERRCPQRMQIGKLMKEAAQVLV